MNLNLAEMTVIALCYFLFRPFEDCDEEDFIHLGQGFLEALPGLSPELRQKVAQMAKERLEYLSGLPSYDEGRLTDLKRQELAFLDSLANDDNFFDQIVN